MDAYEEAYQHAYHTGMLTTKGAKLTFLPKYSHAIGYAPQEFYSTPDTAAYKFMEDARTESFAGGLDDIFKTDIVQSEDRIALILGQLKERDRLKYDNLARIYDDLFRVDQFRAQVPHPQNYLTDATWSGLKDNEFKLREQIRRELTSASQDMGFLSNDLRNSLLEFKLRNSESSMLEDTINSTENNLGGLDEIIGPDGSLQTDPGDLNEIQDHQYRKEYSPKG